jgi:serine/threonine protein kinase
MECLGVDQVLALLDGELDAKRRAEVDAHLDLCPPCLELVALAADDGSTGEASRTRVDAAPPWEELERPNELSPGDRVDEFEVLKRIGRGGMGAVYLALDTKLNRRVALKVITSEQVQAPKAAERFLREARTTARVSHPSIVTIHSVGEHRGSPYLALEYVSGKRLREWMATERSEAAIVRLGADIAEALAEAHRYGVYHRDLKPENVLVDRSERVRLLDFGLAETVAIEDPPTSVRNASSHDDLGPNVTGLAGTPRYMAPEQWRHEPTTGATDVWALGVILYELLGDGAHPITDARHVTEVTRVMSGPLPPLPELVGVSAPAAELVADCLREDPAERPRAAEVMRRLRDLLGASQRSLAPGPVVAPPAADPSRRRIIGAVLAVALGALLGLLPMRPSAVSRASTFMTEIALETPQLPVVTEPAPRSATTPPEDEPTAVPDKPPRARPPRIEEVPSAPPPSPATTPAPSSPPAPAGSSLLREW